LPVVSTIKGGAVGILTQSRLIEYLYDNSLLGKNINQTIAELNFAQKKVVSIQESKTLLEAFNLMNSTKVSSIAVLNLDGTILTNLSGKDLKGLRNDPPFVHLQKTVRDLISSSRQTDYHTFATAICVLPTDSFYQAIGKLVKTKAHRLYVIDDYKRPVGVLSLNDVIEKLSVDIKQA